MKLKLSTFTARLHSATATLCQDYLRPPEVQQPARRRWARFLLLIAIGALATAGIVFLAIKEPAVQTLKITLAGTATNITSLFDDPAQNAILACPCQKQHISWVDYTTFRVYKWFKVNSSFHEILNFTANHSTWSVLHLCNTTNERRRRICSSTLSSIMNNADSRTIRPTANLISKEQLVMDVATSIDTNAYVEAEAEAFLSFSNETESLYSYAEALVNLTRAMKYQFLLNSSSSAQDFWNYSAPTRELLLITYPNLTIFFGMEINWGTYVTICNATFCDETARVSFYRRVLQAASELGGIGAVIVFILRVLLWPILRLTLGFPGPPELMPGPMVQTPAEALPK